VSQNIIPVWQLWYSAPSPALVADATTNFNMVELMWKAPFKQMGVPSFGIQPLKKCTHVQLRASSSERYDVSEWMLRIMTDAWKWIFAPRCPNRQSNNFLQQLIDCSIAFVWSTAMELRAIRTITSMAWV
jgi:hypothetical protein